MKLQRKILQHPRNENISFDKAEHTYTYKDQRYFQGVTSWISEFTEPFNAEGIKYGIVKSKKPEYAHLNSIADVEAEWEEANNYGDYVHEVIEAYVNKGIELKTKELDKFKNFIKREKLNPIWCEWVIYDETVNRASAVDLICERDDEIIIFDLKTMAKPIRFSPYGGSDKHMKPPLDNIPDSKYYKQALQVNIYKYWLENKYGFDVAHVNYILRLRDNICEKIPVINLQDEIKSLYHG